MSTPDIFAKQQSNDSCSSSELSQETQSLVVSLKSLTSPNTANLLSASPGGVEACITNCNSNNNNSNDNNSNSVDQNKDFDNDSHNNTSEDEKSENPMEEDEEDDDSKTEEKTDDESEH